MVLLQKETERHQGSTSMQWFLIDSYDLRYLLVEFIDTKSVFFCPFRRRKSANLPTEGVPNAATDLNLPCAISEARVVDAGSMDKGRRKSTPRYYALPFLFVLLSFLVHAHNIEVKGLSCFLIFFHRVVYRPKQLIMSEGDADKNSTFTRLANCLSFARMKGINRNKR